MKRIQSYIMGQWATGIGTEHTAHHAITGEPLAEVSSAGFDFEAILQYGRAKGAALRKMTFQQRGLMLKALALHMSERKESYYALSAATGATRADSWIDIEGGIGNLFAYASLRRQFGDQPFALEGDVVGLSKGGSFIGHHLLVPKEGVAVHINAFNFPVWGMLEKIAVNLLAGVPAVVKPAESTGFLTELVVRDIVASGILPEGALQLISGFGRGILDGISHEDVVTFTGSAATGQKLRAHARVLSESTPFNLEADSLNASILAPDAAPGTADFAIFIKAVRAEMTVKTGQKCTAIRRIMVPAPWVDEVRAALSAELAKTTIGDPAVEGVRMGALISKLQAKRVAESAAVLAAEQELVYGSPDHVEVVGASASAGAFFSPLLFVNSKPFERTAVHRVEAFGPVSTIMPYRDLDEAVELCKLGKGSLVTSIVTSNADNARQFVMGAAAANGRILVLNERCAKESTGHGSPMPMLSHGGPGRAGGGEEMGGMRGVKHYMQRTALQGHPEMITRIADQFQPGADRPEADPHLFRQHFEDLVVGHTVFTHRHTVTEADITNFANVSGDNFYAHMDATSLEGTVFEQRVAHGYFILSKAAGLFVDPKKGPVLLNYGIEGARFTKPVYPGTTIGVRISVKEKIAQEKRNETDVKKGIVKFWVEVYDHTGDTVAVATILTMVKMRDQA